MSERRQQQQEDPQPEAEETSEMAESPEPDEEPVTYVGLDAYQPRIIDPNAQDEERETQPECPAGHVRIVYRGYSALFERGEFKFRPDQPVCVPSDVAEDLLTWPNEQFEQVER